MPPKKRYPEIHLTPLRGKLKLEDVERAVNQVIAERRAKEEAARAASGTGSRARQ